MNDLSAKLTHKEDLLRWLLWAIAVIDAAELTNGSQPSAAVQAKSESDNNWPISHTPQQTCPSHHLSPRMMLRMQGLEPLSRHMGVDGGRGDIRMAQQHLHHAQISAVVEQMRGKRMAQRVG